MAKTSDNCCKYYNTPTPKHPFDAAKLRFSVELAPCYHWFGSGGLLAHTPNLGCEYYFEVDPVLVMPIVNVWASTQVIVLLGRLIIRDKVKISNLKGWLIENPMVPT